ncbi:MAG: glutathione S-transferase family protein [Rhizomicrobium sp.]
MSHEIILHHYPTSPFSEKIRLAFGIKKLAWRSVEIPNMLPKPDLVPLTGGYRKTPVMQIGADIFCDTQIILRELERRHPSPSLFPHGKGLPYGLALWTDRPFFMATVPTVFAELGDMVPDAFKQDRAKMSGGTFSVEALKAAAPYAHDQWRAHASFLEEQLADGRAFLQGAEATAADIHGHMNIWFAKSFVPHVAEKLMKEFPKLDVWYARMTAIGHGTPTPMDSKEALAIAQAAKPNAKRADDPFDPRGLRAGDKVNVSADDYGRDPVAGEIVFGNAHEIAIARHDTAVGDVVVHFPRAGFVITKR